MSKRSKHTSIEKYHCILPVLKGEASTHHTAKKNGVSPYTIQKWVDKYNLHGVQGLKESKTWNRYSEELKYDAVQAVIFKKQSIIEVTKKFNISDESVLRKWLSKYNDGRKLYRTIGGSGKSTMNKGRKTTLEERIEITQFTIANGQDYQLGVPSAYEEFVSIRNRFKNFAVILYI